jgi:hypothetical protein
VKSRWTAMHAYVGNAASRPNQLGGELKSVRHSNCLDWLDGPQNGPAAGGPAALGTRGGSCDSEVGG